MIGDLLPWKLTIVSFILKENQRCRDLHSPADLPWPAAKF